MPRPRLACGRDKAQANPATSVQRERSIRRDQRKQQTERMQSIPVSRARRHSRSRPMTAATDSDAVLQSCGACGLRRTRPQPQRVTPGRQAVLAQRDAETVGAKARPGAWDAAAHAPGLSRPAVLNRDFFLGVGLKSGVVLPPTFTTATGVSGCVLSGFGAFAGVRVKLLKRANPAKAGDAKSTV